MKRLLPAALALLLAGTLTACHSTPKTPATPTPEITALPTPAPVPTIKTHPVGEKVHTPSADFIVHTIEQRDSTDTDYGNLITAPEGQRLWYLDIEWTNNSPNVQHSCIGPDAYQLRVFDIDGVEMKHPDGARLLKNTDCKDLLQGETGRWQAAFIGKDKHFGWAKFEDYGGHGFALVVLDSNLKLTQSDIK